MTNHVVARFANGSLVKGVSINVDPARPSCHVRSADGVMHEVKFADLKALFFVKSLDGNPAHDEAMTVQPADPRARGAHLIEVLFKDGERLVALANRYPPLGRLFFLVPVDPASNNIRILVNREQLASLEKATSAA
jgi:hypothetical protein